MEVKQERQVIEYFRETGTEEAFCALLESVCPRVRRYYLLRGLDAATADDLTQNVFLKVYRQARELRETDHFYGWLFAIARNEMISYWRRHRSRPDRVELDSLDDHCTESLMIEPEVIPALQLMELLRALDPVERDLLLLRFVEGFSYEELAEAFKLPLGTIKWRIFAIRKKLSRIINGTKNRKSREKIN